MAHIWISYNGNGLTSHAGYGLGRPDQYNPLDLPPLTARVLYKDGYTPVSGARKTFTQVSASPNIWDVTFSSTNWDYGFMEMGTPDMTPEQVPHNLLAVLGANASGVTTMKQMFLGCRNLSSIALFDTSSVVNMDSFCGACKNLVSLPLFDTSSAASLASMLRGCSSLSSVPMFNTSSATSLVDMLSGCSSLRSVPAFNTANCTNFSGMMSDCTSILYAPDLNTSSGLDFGGMFARCTNLQRVPLYQMTSPYRVEDMFRECVNVSSGTYAMYLEASSSLTQYGYYGGCFYNCGINTPSGRQELERIPYDWKRQ
jgi:Mycoplasma protein of unknown function, DUF285.